MAEDGIVAEEEGKAQEAIPEKELERLRAENEALKQQVGRKGVKRAQHGGFWRNFLVWVLIILACIFAFTGSLATWVKTTTLDTSTFVKTVAPLIQDEKVAAALSDKAVTTLFANYNIQAEIEKVLPENLQFIAEPVANGLENFAKTATTRILTSDQFKWVWEKILTLAHGEAIKVITGEGDVKVARDGTVSLDIGQLLNQVKEELVAKGLTFLNKVPVPADMGAVALFKSDQLGMVKGIVDLLNTLGWLLPLLALLFLGGALAVAKDRRRALMQVSIALAVTMGLVLVALSVTKTELLGQIKIQANKEAATIVWNQLLQGFVRAEFGILFLGIVVACVAAVTGPYGWAVKTRGWTSEFFEKRRARREGGEERGEFGKWVTAHAWGLRVAGLVVALIILVLMRPISALLVIIVGLLLLIYLVVVELLR